MKNLRLVLFILLGLWVAQPVCAQKLRLKKPKKKKKTETQLLDSLSAAQAPTIDLEEEEPEVKEPKKKKPKKNVYYGLKTRKARISRRSGSKQLYEEFYYLQIPQKPNEYVPEKYFYDPEDRKVKFSRTLAEKEDILILHGPYKRYLDGQLVTEGIFYIGTKHGRWMEYFSNDVLKNKEKFYRGWPKEAEVTYHDTEGTKIKEVIPVKYGVRDGTYYYFHDNGLLGVTGKYENDRRIGVWREYYKYRRNRRNRKREVQYAEDGYDSAFKPYILKEWSQEGKQIYDRDTHRKRLNQS